MRNCYNTGSVTVTGVAFVGGISGYADPWDNKVVNNYNTGKVKASTKGTFKGQVIGGYEGAEIVQKRNIYDNYYTGSGKAYGWGFVTWHKWVAKASKVSPIKAANCPAVLAINKLDTVEPEKLLAVIALYSEAYAFNAIVPISAKTGDGVEELLKELDKFAVESPALFPEGVTTDQPEKQVCAELIREKLLLNLEREVPHGTAVEITRFSERDDGIIDLEATIYCEKASHKGIIIGKHGAMLKKIGEDARKDIEEFMGTKVFLQTWVKVKEKWRDSNSLLRNFGYTDT